MISWLQIDMISVPNICPVLLLIISKYYCAALKSLNSKLVCVVIQVNASKNLILVSWILSNSIFQQKAKILKLQARAFSSTKNCATVDFINRTRYGQNLGVCSVFIYDW